MDNEIVEKILGLDIRAKTNKCEERIIRLTDFKNNENSTMELKSLGLPNEPKRQIIITINCDGYSLEIV